MARSVALARNEPSIFEANAEPCAVVEASRIAFGDG